MTTVQSNLDLVERARRVMPGGVNSGNRALPWPLAIVEASGAYFSDALATVAILQDGAAHQHTFRLAQRATSGIQQIAGELGIPMKVVVFGSVFVPYFMEGPIESYTDLLRNNNARDTWFRRTMCENGIFMIPTALKRNHMSAVHTDADIDLTLEIARRVLGRLPATLE